MSSDWSLDKGKGYHTFEVKTDIEKQSPVDSKGLPGYMSQLDADFVTEYKFNTLKTLPLGIMISVNLVRDEHVCDMRLLSPIPPKVGGSNLRHAEVCQE